MTTWIPNLQWLKCRHIKQCLKQDEIMFMLILILRNLWKSANKVTHLGVVLWWSLVYKMKAHGTVAPLHCVQENQLGSFCQIFTPPGLSQEPPALSPRLWFNWCVVEPRPEHSFKKISRWLLSAARVESRWWTETLITRVFYSILKLLMECKFGALLMIFCQPHRKKNQSLLQYVSSV